MRDTSEAFANLPAVDADEFRAAMASFAAGVTVITTLDAGGQPRALTATAFSSVSADPPMCLVCVHKQARPYRSLVERACFAVNVLTAEQAALSARCAAPVEDRLAGVNWAPGSFTGCPLIQGVLAWMECEVAEIHSSGDHDIVIGLLRSVHVRDGAPLLYWRGDYLEGSRPPPRVETTRATSEAPAFTYIESLGGVPATSPIPGEYQTSETAVAAAPAESVIPDEFAKYLVDQEHHKYTTEQHQVWREVLIRNRRLVSEHERFVHPAYLEGMKTLSLPEHIPRVEEINERLAPTGWRTICVDGYVPSSAYAGLMALRIFPISRQIRRSEHIDFAPAPDMVHDILGHLAMLYLPAHRQFLRRLSQVMAYAIANELDQDFYSTSVHMADLKWDPASDPSDVALAEERVAAVHKKMANNASELTHLRRMYVWSVEFGLMGSLEDFSIFGAAFFSSPTEFRAVCSGSAKLLPYSLDVIHYENAFSDLLSQYFVTRDFTELEDVLSKYELRLAHRGEPPRTSEIRDIRPTTKERRRGNA